MVLSLIKYAKRFEVSNTDIIEKYCMYKTKYISWIHHKTMTQHILISNLMIMKSVSSVLRDTVHYPMRVKQVKLENEKRMLYRECQSFARV